MDDERALLETLRPFLVAIVRRSEAGLLVRQLSSTFALTPREAEVVALVVRGKRNAEIAATLFLAPTTVRTHLSNIYPKLGVTTRAQMKALVLEGAVLPGGFLDEVLAASFDAYGLTRREVEVLVLASHGKRDGEISEALAIATTTVKKHLEHIYGKLGVRNRMEAASHAFALGLADS